MHFNIKRTKSKDGLSYAIIAEGGTLTAAARTRSDADLIADVLLRNRLAKKQGLSDFELVAFEVVYAISKLAKPRNK